MVTVMYVNCGRVVHIVLWGRVVYTAYCGRVVQVWWIDDQL